MGTRRSLTISSSLFSGVLVINITWRGKSYVGTLLDSKIPNSKWEKHR